MPRRAPNQATAQMLYFSVLFEYGLVHDRRPRPSATDLRSQWEHDAIHNPDDERGFSCFRTDPSVDWAWIAKRFPKYFQGKRGEWVVHENMEQMAAAVGYIKLPDVPSADEPAEDE